MTKASSHNGYLDFLKFLFALGVMGIHTALAGFDFTFIRSGYEGVDFYFMVSGYFTTRQALRSRRKAEPHAIPRYFARRLMSFYPFYFVAWLYGFILLQIVTRPGIEGFFCNLWNSVFDVIPLQVVGLPSLCVTSVQWYVGAMFLISPMVYALVFRFGENLTRAFAPILSVMLFGILYLQVGTLGTPGFNLGFLFDGLPRALGDMLLGGTVYEVSRCLARIRLTHMGMLLLHGVRVVLLAMVLISCVLETNGYKTFVAVFVTFLYLCLLFAYPVEYALFRCRLFSELGKISMLSFLVHVPTGTLINELLPGWGKEARLVLYYIASLLVAYGLYYLTVWLVKKWQQLHHLLGCMPPDTPCEV